MPQLVGLDPNAYPGTGKYVRVTLRAEYTPLSSVNTIRTLIAKQLSGGDTGFVLASGPTAPTLSATTAGFGYAFSDAVIRTLGWPRTWTELLAPLSCFGGVVKCNIELLKAELVEGARSASTAGEAASEQDAPLSGEIKGVGVLIGLAALAIIAWTVAPFIPRRSS